MKRFWILPGLVRVVSFAVLGWIGGRIYQEAPRLVDKLVTTDGEVVIDEGEIQVGQNVCRSLGGTEGGSIWGHGRYVAPDWTADWLHREAMFILDGWANEEFSAAADDLDAEQQAQLSGRLANRMRTNTYDPATGTVTTDPIRDKAFRANLAQDSEVFSNGNPMIHHATNTSKRNDFDVRELRQDWIVQPNDWHSFRLDHEPGLNETSVLQRIAACPKSIPLMTSWARAGRTATLHTLKQLFGT